MVAVAASREQWESLLRALPRCRCGAVAEREVGGRVACAACVVGAPQMRTRALPHAAAAGAIAAALSPFEPDGQWEVPCGG
jgi:hypothetical protein